MQPLPDGVSQLSVDRAFVVQFEAETDIKGARFVGRVEHVPSGDAERFVSLAQLLDFVERKLAQAIHQNGI